MKSIVSLSQDEINYLVSFEQQGLLKKEFPGRFSVSLEEIIIPYRRRKLLEKIKNNLVN